MSRDPGSATGSVLCVHFGVISLQKTPSVKNLKLRFKNKGREVGIANDDATATYFYADRHSDRPM